MADPKPPAVASRVVGMLIDRLGAERVMSEPNIVEGYRRDQTALAASGRPVAVVRARSVDEVVGTLQTAGECGVPVVPRGGGTGLAGGANAIEGCIVLSTAAMDSILSIDEVGRTARVQCGVLNGALAAALAPHGLWYPPDPASRAISTIGGNIATNAGGSCCVKYGVTGDHVAALTVVLPDGTVLETGGTTRKNVAGYDITRLLVGSEGTLAVIVDATVWLRVAPNSPSTLVALFAAPADAGNAVAQIERVMEPSLLELMDRTTIGAVEAMTHMGLDTGAGALLLMQSNTATSGSDIERAAAACEAAGATYVVHSNDPAEGDQLLAARRAALPALERLGTTLLDDVAVPKPAIATMLERIEAIAQREEVLVGTFGHAGDGNLHPTVIFDPAEPTQRAAAQRAFDAIVRAAVELGGTITGEHGVGSLKRPYLDTALGARQRQLMANIKSAFDPAGILNPGKAI